MMRYTIQLTHLREVRSVTTVLRLKALFTLRQLVVVRQVFMNMIGERYISTLYITKEDMSRVRARKDMKINHVRINNGDQLTLSINGEENEKICGNDEYSESIVTVDTIKDHRNPDYNKLNDGGVRELSEFGMILVSRILYYSVRIR